LTTNETGEAIDATLVSQVTYDPTGGEYSSSLGNLATEVKYRDNRARLVALRLIPPTNYLNKTSPYLNAWNANYDASSNVTSMDDNYVMGNWSYAYDPLNRLTDAYATQTLNGYFSNQGCQYTYDSFGNRTGTATYDPSNVGLVCANTTTTYTTNNQANAASGFTYDSSGNVTYDGTYTYTYDAENRISAVNGHSTSASYQYNAEGQRVTSVVNGVTTLFGRDIGGQLQWRNYVPGYPEEIYLNGRHFGSLYTNSDDTLNRVEYSAVDWLGTERARFDSNANLLGAFTSDPFGDVLATKLDSGTDDNNIHLTGKERDTESGLDYFGARYYGSSMGRFLSPDPAGMQAADLEFPQSLNRYAYVWNNPLSFTDPTGLDCAYLNDAGTGLEKGGLDQSSSSGECGRTGGYWVDGGLTNINVNADQGSVQLTGTTNGTDQTHASYQDTSVFVGMYQNSSVNPFGHIAIGITGQTPVGLNPTSDLNFLIYATYGGKGGGVSGVVKPQGPKGLKKFVWVPVTGMQAKMIQDQLNRAMGNAPNYDIFGGGGPACDCAGFAQQMLGDAGINSGPPTDIPSTLMQQLGSQYPQQ